MLSHKWFYLVFIFCLCALILLSQQREVYTELPNVRVRLFSLNNYGGAVYVLSGDNVYWEMKWSDLSPNLNDINSFQIGEGYRMVVYAEDNFRGASAEFSGPRNLPYKHMFSSQIPKIRSIKVFRINNPPIINKPLSTLFARYNIQPKCRTAQTPRNDPGAIPGVASIRSNFLDRHNIQCNKDEYLTRYTLKRASDGNIYYDYTCCKPSIENQDPQRPMIKTLNTIDSAPNTYTPITDTLEFQSPYLDRQHIGRACIDDSATGDNAKLLSRIQLISHYNPPRFQYKYDCTEMKSNEGMVKVRNMCRHMSTPGIDEAYGMDNHVDVQIGCADGEGIRDLVMQRYNDNGKWKQRYVGWCCKPEFQETSS